MEIVGTDPSDLIASFDEPEIRTTLATLDGLIVGALPGRSRVVWEGPFWGGTDQRIIGYGTIMQPRPRRDDVRWFLVGLARQKRNYSIYLNAVENDAYLAHQYGDRLGTVDLGAASIGFRSLDAIDLNVLDEMLRRANAIVPPDPVEGRDSPG